MEPDLFWDLFRAWWPLCLVCILFYLFFKGWKLKRSAESPRDADSFAPSSIGRARMLIAAILIVVTNHLIFNNASYGLLPPMTDGQLLILAIFFTFGIAFAFRVIRFR
jgi:hypothetical protein